MRSMRAVVPLIAALLFITNVADAPGQGCAALSFDGIDDFVLIGDTPSLDVTDAITIEAWIYPTGPGGNGSIEGGIIVNKEGSYEIARFADGSIWFALSNSSPGWNWTPTGFIAPLLTWTHIGFSYDAYAGEVRLVANGQTHFLAAAAGSIGDQHSDMNEARIGSRQGIPTRTFEGLIDEVRIWASARSAFQIQAVMAGPLAASEPGLVGFWQMNEGSTSLAAQVVADSSSSQADGTRGALVSADSDDPLWNVSTLPPVACTAPALGTAGGSSVGLGLGGPFDLLTVNGSAGLRVRRVDVGLGSPITIAVAQPSTNPLPSAFAVIGYIGVPSPVDAYTLPFGIGTLCFAPPQLFPSYPGLFTLTNNFGPEPGQLVGSNPAPWSFTAAGLPFAFQFTLQGVIQQDPGTVRVMNGVIVNVQ